jgi:hypothetical protein
MKSVRVLVLIALMPALMFACATVVVGVDITGNPWISVTTEETFVDESTGSVLCTTQTTCFTFETDGSYTYTSSTVEHAENNCGQPESARMTSTSTGEWTIFNVDEDGGTFLNLHQTGSEYSSRYGDTDAVTSEDNSIYDYQVSLGHGSDGGGAFLYVGSTYYGGGFFRRDADGACE